jgi:hypothetical protein
MLKFTSSGQFLTTKKTYEKFLYSKAKWLSNALVALPHIELLFLRNTKISIFGGISKILKLIVFGQFWVVLLRICCIGSGWEHAQSKAKILKPSNSSTMNPNTTWIGLLKSYHPYLPP